MMLHTLHHIQPVSWQMWALYNYDNNKNIEQCKRSLNIQQKYFSSQLKILILWLLHISYIATARSTCTSWSSELGHYCANTGNLLYYIACTTNLWLYIHLLICAIITGTKTSICINGRVWQDDTSRTVCCNTKGILKILIY